MSEDKIYTVVQEPEFYYDFTVVMRYKIVNGRMFIIELKQTQPQLLPR